MDIARESMIQTKETCFDWHIKNKHSVTSIIIWHFFSKFMLKLFSYFDQNIYFYLEGLEVVTFIIMYASSGTSHQCVNSTTAYISIGWYWYRKLGVRQYQDIGYRLKKKSRSDFTSFCFLQWANKCSLKYQDYKII